MYTYFCVFNLINFSSVLLSFIQIMLSYSSGEWISCCVRHFYMQTINNASIHHVHLPPHVWKGLWHPQESFKVKYCTTVACCGVVEHFQLLFHKAIDALLRKMFNEI